MPKQIISVACPVVLSHYPFVENNLIHTLNIVVEQLLVTYPVVHRFWPWFVPFYIVFGWCNQSCIAADSQWCKLKLLCSIGRTQEEGNRAKATYCNLGSEMSWSAAALRWDQGMKIVLFLLTMMNQAPSLIICTSLFYVQSKEIDEGDEKFTEVVISDVLISKHTKFHFRESEKLGKGSWKKRFSSKVSRSSCIWPGQKYHKNSHILGRIRCACKSNGKQSKLSKLCWI